MWSFLGIAAIGAPELKHQFGIQPSKGFALCQQWEAHAIPASRRFLERKHQILANLVQLEPLGFSHRAATTQRHQRHLETWA